MVEVMTSYKETEIGSIPADWDVAALHTLGTGSVPAVKAGPFGSAITKDMYVRRGYKVYGQEQVIRGDHEFGDYYIDEAKYRELSSYRITPGDILFSLVGTLGKTLVVPDDATEGVINPRLLRLSLDPDCINPNFLKQLFESDHFQSILSRYAQGGTMGILNARILRSVQIPLPPLPEQRAIAEALSDVDALIEQLDTLIAKKRAVKTATMQQLLTGQQRLPGFDGAWETRRLGEIGDFSKGRGIPKKDTAESGIPCVRYAELYTHHRNVIRDFVSFIPRSVTESARELKTGDLLFAGSGETKEEIGMCAAYLGTDEAYAGGDIVILSLHAEDPRFLGYALNSPAAVEQKSSMAQGDAVVHLYARHLSEVEISLPPVEEQRAVATVLSDMDAEIEALESRRNKTKNIKQGMMQELLTGRTRLV